MIIPQETIVYILRKFNYLVSNMVHYLLHILWFFTQFFSESSSIMIIYNKVLHNRAKLVHHQSTYEAHCIFLPFKSQVHSRQGSLHIFHVWVKSKLFSIMLIWHPGLIFIVCIKTKFNFFLILSSIKDNFIHLFLTSTRS